MPIDPENRLSQPQFAVTLQPQAWRFDSGAEESIVLAARRAGIRMPSSCRNGTCRACRCRLLEGSVVYAVERPGLTPDEKEEGWILPCVAHARAPLVIEAPGARVREPPAPLPATLTGARR